MARRGEIGDEKDGRDSSVEKGLKRCGRPASFSSPLFLISTTTFILLLLTLLSITSPGDAAEAPPRRVKNKAGTNAVIAKTGGKTPLEVNKAKGSELQEPHVANLDFVIDDEDLFPAFVAFVKQKTGGQGVEPLYFLDQVKDYKQVDPDDAVSLNRFGKYLYEEFVTGDSMVTFDNYQITEDLKNAYDNDAFAIDSWEPAIGEAQSMMLTHLGAWQNSQSWQTAIQRWVAKQEAKIKKLRFRWFKKNRTKQQAIQKASQKSGVALPGGGDGDQ